MLYMGSDVTGITGYELDGAMDEVCLFNRVLSEEELSEIYLDANCILSEANPDDSVIQAVPTLAHRWIRDGYWRSSNR